MHGALINGSGPAGPTTTLGHQPSSELVNGNKTEQSAHQFHSNSTNASALETLGPAAKLTDADPSEIPPASGPGGRQNAVTINDILERRAKAGRLIAPTASYSDSDMFKGPQVGKPKSKSMEHHLSPESLSRHPCSLKQAARHLKNPGLISLGGGLPCAEYFPIDSITLKVPIPPNFSEAATSSSGAEVRIGKYDVTDPAIQGTYDLSIALNYAQATGSAQLSRFVTEHTELVHNPPYSDWRSCLTIGSTGALEQALRMLCDGPGRGDCLLTEEYSFATALETAGPLGIKVVGVKMDEQGLLPEAMDELLSGWKPEEREGRRKPHVLYTVPSGQNPTGATQGLERRRELYEVARKHDVFVIEDEPYYYIQMPLETAGSTATAGQEGKEETVDQFIASLVPSLLSMDVDGRVLRMDSFSKVVVPGSRVGWVTASEEIIERFIRHAEVCNQGPSGISQVVLYKLLDEQWGHEGYFKWLMNLRGEYTKRRDTMVAAVEKFLPKEVVSWSVPVSGMFYWLKVDHTQHPVIQAGKAILEVEEEIYNSCIAKGVLVARGSWFRAEQDTEPNELFFRATFAAATAENMTEAIRRFGEAVRESFKL
ncbi:pyridoxal phosphate-dependent transferase [Pseudoneurospora amorphoporcata]|uniref:aromatic-amino-acid transaminase n=1 Tax=Pseudoneurospora amorphoporcata TaxID=241081 RepID=A0AAN6NZU3_9PEZI|nr:pyridoxal phosphate-dependent transferase [Pseudoneurospora amorphoporcata]